MSSEASELPLAEGPLARCAPWRLNLRPGNLPAPAAHVPIRHGHGNRAPGAKTQVGEGWQFVSFDAEYVERLAARDRVTEAHFVSYFGELMRLKLRARLDSKEAIEDVRQETFVRVLTQLQSGNLRSPDSLGAFVNATCNHVLLEHYRSKGRHESPLDDDIRENLREPGMTALGELEQTELQTRVRLALKGLCERDRNLLQRVLLEERDKEQVCAELGVTREHLRVLVHRAKQSFKSYFIKNLGSPRDLGSWAP